MNLQPDVKRGFVVNTIAASPVVPHRLRYRILRWYGVQIPSDSLVLDGCYFTHPDVEIGEGTFVNVGCIFDSAAPITIGERCNIAMRVIFGTSFHDVGPSQWRATRAPGRPIVVEDGCWIGTAVVVEPGVTVARGCVIAAGAVVSESTEPDGLYGGIPARRLKGLPVESRVPSASR